MIIRLCIVLTLTLCTLVCDTFPASLHYELFLLLQLLWCLIRRLSIDDLTCTRSIAFDFGKGFSDMARYFSLIDTKHECVKDSWREVIVVDLLTLMRRL